jgi:hypothetical protein
MFEGSLENDKIDTHFMSAEALLLPSISETFGMVYAESLLSGCPIMYSKNYLGFDEFFEGVGTGVDPMSVDSIREGIEDLYDNGSKYRMNIESLKNTDEFRVFTIDYIREKYNSTIMEVVEAKE